MIYLDNHATTRLAPEALAAMLPFLQESYANSGSVTHEFGRSVAESLNESLSRFSKCLGASADQIIITSGATEAANLAIFGVCQHPRMQRRKIVAVETEHRAVLDPILRLEANGFQVDWIPVFQQGHPQAGLVDLDVAKQMIDETTAIVCTMWVNNEIGAIQPIEHLSELARSVGAISFCDGTAGVGRMAADVERLGIDLLAFSAHKFYGPKGVGGLYVRRQNRGLRIRPQIFGGGQQHGLRSGTLNVAGVIGMCAAMELCEASRQEDRQRIQRLQARLVEVLQRETDSQVLLNGPSVGATRAIENVNVEWKGVEGQSLMLAAPDICISSGSACSAAEQTVSHVLTAIGLTADEARSSTRIGLGRFTTELEVDLAAERLLEAYNRLRRLH